mgnify:CR=1 FL=1
MPSPWELEDAEERNQEYPDSFQIPSLEERSSLNSMDFAKLLFHERESGITERMWVLVHDNDDGSYKGELNNNPLFMTAIQCGDSVKFLPKHIIDTIRVGD